MPRLLISLLTASTSRSDPFRSVRSNDCKQTSGSAFSVNILVPEKDVKFEGQVKQYDVRPAMSPSPSWFLTATLILPASPRSQSSAASGNTVSRIFCGSCGAALSHNSKAFGDSQAIQVGVFPELYELPVQAELFSKDRAFGLVPCKGADIKETA